MHFEQNWRMVVFDIALVILVAWFRFLFLLTCAVYWAKWIKKVIFCTRPNLPQLEEAFPAKYRYWSFKALFQLDMSEFSLKCFTSFGILETIYYNDLAAIWKTIYTSRNHIVSSYFISHISYENRTSLPLLKHLPILRTLQVPEFLQMLRRFLGLIFYVEAYMNIVWPMGLTREGYFTRDLLVQSFTCQLFQSRLYIWQNIGSCINETPVFQKQDHAQVMAQAYLTFQVNLTGYSRRNYSDGNISAIKHIYPKITLAPSNRDFNQIIKNTIIN